MRKSIRTFMSALIVTLMAAAALPVFAQQSLNPRTTKAKPWSQLSSADRQRILAETCPALLDMETPNRQKGIPALKIKNLKVPVKAVGPSYVGDKAARLWGMMIFNNQWEDGEEKYGFYEFRAQEETEIMPITINKKLNANGGGVLIDSDYYFVNYSVLYGTFFVSRYVYNLNSETFTLENQTGTPQDIAPGSAVVYDPITQLAYGSFLSTDGKSFVFASMDYKTWTRKDIKTIDKNFIVIAVDSNGQLFAIDPAGDLYKVDKATGDMEKVGNTTFMPKYAQSAVIDPSTNIMYWASIDSEGNSVLYTVDTKTAAMEPVYEFENSEEFVSLTIPAPEAAEKAPGAVTDLDVSVDETNPNRVLVSFLMPSMTYDEQTELTGNLEYTIVCNDVEKVKATAPAGETVEAVIDALPDGMTTFVVAAANETGLGAKRKVSEYVGYDNPEEVTDVKFMLNDNNATVTWKAPGATGVHGGMVDTGKFTYTIYRYPEHKIVAANIKENTIQENIDLTKLRNCYYGVVASSRKMKSAEAFSNRIKVGDAIVPPYQESFEEAENFNLYTTFDGNNDGKIWEFYYDCASISFNVSLPNDDWLFTPAIRLQGGKRYEVSFDLSAGLSDFTQKVEVKWGKTPDVAGMTEILMEATDFNTKGYQTIKTTMLPKEDGIYHIGFHDISAPFQYRTKLKNLVISDGLSLDVPGMVTNMTVTPAANGAMGATVAFKTPTKTMSNMDLTNITKVEIYRDKDQLIKTFDAPAVGAQLSFTDESITKSGLYTYAVVAYNESGAGETVEQSVYVGADKPAAPGGVKAVDNGDGTFTVSWNAVNVGTNGGYVDPAGVKYTIYGIDEEGYLGDKIADITETSYTVKDKKVDEGDDRQEALVIEAFNEVGVSERVVASLVAGVSRVLPFQESFANTHLSNFMWEKRDGETKWGIYDAISADGDNGSLGFFAKKSGDSSTFGTSKYTLADTKKPTLVMNYQAASQSKGSIVIAADKGQSGAEPVVLKTIDLGTASAGEWQTAVVDLSTLLKENYILLMVTVKGETVGSGAYVDNIRMYDLLDNDISVQAKAVDKCKVGQYLQIQARVANAGPKDVAPADYSVKFFVNDKQVDEVAADKLMNLKAYDGVAAYTFNYAPTVFDGEKMTVKVKAEYADDQYQTDNHVAMEVKVLQNDVPAITDLRASQEGADVMLTWTAPVTESSGSLTVTEDFEDETTFPRFSTGGISADVHEGSWGDWKLFDGDAGNTYGWESYQFPNMGSPMAYIVFRPADVFDMSKPDEAAFIAPYSGDQFLLCFSTVPTKEQPQNNDWLISPPLNGKAQTISFQARELTNEYGNEQFEVLYSTTGTAVEDFKSLKTYEAGLAWAEFTADLPEGARHFAIRCVSKDIFGLLVDAVRYSPEKLNIPEMTGFNLYRNGERIARLPKTDTRYTDKGRAESADSYYMTVMYGSVESPLSNLASLTAINPAVISEAQLMEADVTVYTADGALVAQGKGVYAHLRGGLYVVKFNDNGKIVNVVKR